MYGQDDSPILSRLVRVFQLAQMMKGGRYAEEDRRVAAEDRARRVARENRVDQDADMTLQLDLAEAGARPGNAEAESALDSLYGPVKNPRHRLDTRLGTYYLPTIEEKQQRDLELLRKKKDVETVAKFLEESMIQGIKTDEAIRQAKLMNDILADREKLQYETLTPLTIERERNLAQIRTDESARREAVVGPITERNKTAGELERQEKLLPGRVREAEEKARVTAPYKHKEKADPRIAKIEKAEVEAKALEAEAKAHEEAGDLVQAERKRAEAAGKRKIAKLYKKRIKKENKETEPQSSATPPSSSGKRKVGDVVTYQGERYRITRINGDNLELEPIQ